MARGYQKISLLEELNQMNTDLISGISHEFRLPSSLIGFSEIHIIRSGNNTGASKEFVEIILLEGKRLAKLINDVLHKEFGVIITDTGIGIAKIDLPYIFQNTLTIANHHL